MALSTTPHIRSPSALVPAASSGKLQDRYPFAGERLRSECRRVRTVYQTHGMVSVGLDTSGYLFPGW